MMDFNYYLTELVREYGEVSIRLDSDGRICAAINGASFPKFEGALTVDCVGYGETVLDAVGEAQVDLS